MGILNDVKALERVLGLILILLTPMSAYYWFTPPLLVGIMAWVSGILATVGLRLIFK